jgi:O-antigen/teichoic acid export membrane protein
VPEPETELTRVRQGSRVRRPWLPTTLDSVAGGNGPPARVGHPGGQTAGGASRDRLADVARGGTLNLAGAVVAGVTTLVVTVIITRRFSKPVAGAFFTATSAFLIVEAIASLGADVGLTYFIARLRSLNEAVRIPAIRRAAIGPALVASLAATALLVLLADPLARLLLHGQVANVGVTPAAVAEALRALAFMVPFAALLDVFLGASRGYRDMRPTVMVDRMGRSVAQLAGVMVAVAVGSAALLAPLWALPYVPAVVIAWLWLRRIGRNPASRRSDLLDVPPELAALMALATPVPHASNTAARGRRAGGRLTQRRLANANPRGFWIFTAPRAVASLMSIILQRLDIVLVAIMRGPAEAAVYTAATRFLVAGQFGGMALTRAAQPRVTELFAVGDLRGTNVVYRATTAWLILLTWPIYLLAVVFGPQVLGLFGHSYRAGATVMVILGLTMLLASACGQVDMMLITSGRSSWSLANGLLQVAVNVGLDLLLIPKYGITGAAIGWAAAITLGNLMPLAQLAAVTKLHPFGRGTLVAILLTTLSFGVIPIVARSVLGGGASVLAAAIAAGCALQATGLWWFRGSLRLRAMPGLSRLRTRRRCA